VDTEEGMRGNYSITFDDRLTSVQQLANEAVIWMHLKHRNLLPLYGVSTSIGIAHGQPCLVSPWMENGEICVFAGNNPTFNRFSLASDPCLPRDIGLNPFSWQTYARASVTCIQKASPMKT